MKALRVPAMAALAGALLLLFLFPRVDPASKFRTTVDRNDAILRARQLTARYGVNTDTWKVAVTQLTDEKLRAYLSAYPGDAAARLFSPLAWGILFTSPAGKQTVRVKLFADGRPAEWELKPPSDTPALQATVDPETVLRDFAGSNRSAFTPSGRDWQWSADKAFPLVARLSVIARDGRVSSAALTASYGKGFSYKDVPVGKVTGLAITAFVRFVAFCVAFVLAVRAWFRGLLSWRLPAGLLAALAVWGALMVWAGPDYQAMLYGKSRGLQAQLDATQQSIGDGSPEKNAGAEVGFKVGLWMTFLAPVCLPFLSMFAFGGAGFAMARGRFRPKWYSTEALLRGNLFDRKVGAPIAAGALCGVAAAAVPLVVAWLFRGAALLFHDMSILAAPVALVGLARLSAVVPALGFLGLVFPAAYGLRRKWSRIAALGVLAAVYLFGSTEAFDLVLPGLLSAAIASAIYVGVYWKFDLLASAAAIFTAQALAAPAILLAQPASGLRDSGVRVLACLLAAIAASINFAIRGREAESVREEGFLEPGIASGEGPSLSNRKRLEAEFQVARRAQQDALPAVPPVIAGYSFSGSCDPAQQVGGDLYDLFPLPDGRLGIAVADVSGKGVPAALYMMVTKGLLTATAQDSSDLAYILRHVNAHLYRACRKKVFVTMAAVAMDPASRRLEYARAGHNPIVWRRAGRGETLLRKPSGLGLGMCSADQFARSLRLEELDLEPGDAVVLYSDGVTEAINGVMDQFGEERLMRSVERADGLPADQTRTVILRDLAEFTAGTPSRDDVTVVVLRVDDLT